MLELDQILRANEINFAILAALPAFFLSLGLIVAVRAWFRMVGTLQSYTICYLVNFLKVNSILLISVGRDDMLGLTIALFTWLYKFIVPDYQLYL